MVRTLRVALVQMNPVVGDLSGNKERILALAEEARAADADVAVFPELAVTGYPPEDLVLRKDFIAANRAVVEEAARWTRGKDLLLVVGFVDRERALYNAAALLHQGRVAGVVRKVHLPNYGVFDEKRYFARGRRRSVFRFRGIRIGVTICEDIWHARGPALLQARRGGAAVLFNLNASPFHVGKWREREALLARRAEEYGAYLCYVNCTGGQDELVFDGNSLVYDPSGRRAARAALFEEEILVADLEADHFRRGEMPRKTEVDLEVRDLGGGALQDRRPIPSRVAPMPVEEEEVWRALVTGTRDYVKKNGFRRVIVGLSGGIDSALTAAVAADALGPENVRCLFMPSRFTSEESRADAEALARNLGIPLEEIPMDGLFHAYLKALAPAFAGRPQDVTEENLQARIRGNLLMAFSNKFGELVLTTGNKSEYSTGYATLYGDMSGGFAVLKDVLKTRVYRLAEHRNRERPVIPENILRKAPTAELKENQTDQDTLPPYPVLDAILARYVEEEAAPGALVAEGMDPETVYRVVRLVDRAEYKRRQAPPGLKITKRAFGRDRRMPITNRFHPG